MEELDELLFGEYSYYTSSDSEGVYLAVISQYSEDELSIKRLKETLEQLGLQFVGVRTSSPKDWLKNVVLEPFELTDGVVVDPTEHNIPESSGLIVLKIPQGLAFGTGLHQTTKMCATLLKKYLRPGMDVLDLGCGSGILGILAKKLGARRVLAVDNDPLAVEAATENATRNGVELEVRNSDLFSNVDGTFDVIVSNIVAEILLKALEDAPRFLKENGLMILSGVINEKAHLFENFRIIEKMVTDEWTSFVIEI